MRRGDTLRQRRLSDPGRTDEAENRPLHVGVQLAHRQVLEDAVLRLLETRVVAVERLPRARQIDPLLGPLVPRQGDQPVDVGARHGVLGRGDRHARQAVELAQRLLQRGLRHAGRLDLLPQLLDLLGLIVVLSELLPNRLELLAQQVLALALAHLRLHLGLDLRAELEHLELLDEDAVQLIHAGADIERIEHLLPGGRRQRGQARRNEVGQLAGLGDVPGQCLQLVGEERRQRDHLLKVVLYVSLQGVDLETVVVGDDLFGSPHRRAQEGLRREDAVQRHARESLDNQPQAAVRQLEHLVDVRDRADAVEIVLAGLFRRRLALREDADELVALDGRLDEPHGTLSGHRQRHEGVGEQNRVAERQDRQLRRNGQRPFRRWSSLGVRMARFVVHRTQPDNRRLRLRLPPNRA